MASDIKIDVTVHVSDVLKAMFGCCDVPEKPVASPVTQPKPDLLGDWQPLLLRRDGQRPMAFVGMALLDRRCIIDDPAGRAEQTLSFYLAQDGAVIASLAFVPSEARAVWPSFRCKVINNAEELARFLKDWQPELGVCQAMPAKDSRIAACVTGSPVARSTFSSMTADCLSPAVLQG